MDIEYNNKLLAIMNKHNTDIWNDDCKNDPDYHALQGMRWPYKEFDKAASIQKEKDYIEMMEEKQASEYRNKRAYRRASKPIGSVTIGSYKFRSKKK